MKLKAFFLLQAFIFFLSATGFSADRTPTGDLWTDDYIERLEKLKIGFHDMATKKLEELQKDYEENMQELNKKPSEESESQRTKREFDSINAELDEAREEHLRNMREFEAKEDLSRSPFPAFSASIQMPEKQPMVFRNSTLNAPAEHNFGNTAQRLKTLADRANEHMLKVQAEIEARNNKINK